MLIAAFAGSLLLASTALSDVSVQGNGVQAWVGGSADFYIAQTVTGTDPLTATATVATPQNQPTPVPIESPGASLQLNPFDWNFLMSPANPPLGPFAYVAIVMMLAALGAGIYFYFVKRPEWKRTNTVLYKAANRFAQPAIWLGIVGLLFIVTRVVQLDFFNLRFWLYLWLVALVGVAVWFILWYRNSYPKEIAKFTKVQRQKKYMTGSGKVSSRQSRPVPQPKRPAAPPTASGATGTSTSDAPKPATGSESTTKGSRKGGKRR